MGASPVKPTTPGDEPAAHGSGSGNRNGNGNGVGDGDGDERTPLLPASERGTGDDAEETSLRRAKRWSSTNAVGGFMALLVTAAVIVLCVFFGGNNTLFLIPYPKVPTVLN